jgi:transmembrane protein EpsG
MTIYAAIFFAVLMCSLACKATQDRLEILFCALCLIPFVVFPGARFDVGGSDYPLYESSYLTIKEIGYNPHYEPLFNLLLHVFNGLGFSFNFFLFFVTLVSSLLLFYGIKKNTNSIFLGLIIYMGKLYIFYNFVLVRQMIAIPLVWIAIAHLRDSRKFRFVALIITASLFHLSAIVLLPIAFLKDMEISAIKVCLILGVAVVIAVGNNLFLSLIMRVHPYLEYRLGGYMERENLINPLNYPENLSMLFVATYYRKQLAAGIKNFTLYYNMLVLFAFILIAFYNVDAFKRVRDYFIISYIVVIPVIIVSLKNATAKLFVTGMFLAYFSLLYFRSIVAFDATTGGTCTLIPYKSVLF